jgi:hypothetical protein
MATSVPDLRRVPFKIDGKQYWVTYSANIGTNSNSGIPGISRPGVGQFLQPIRIDFGPNSLTDYTVPGRTDFTRLLNTPQAQTALQSDYSYIAGVYKKEGYTGAASKAAEISKQTASWNNINPGNGKSANIDPTKSNSIIIGTPPDVSNPTSFTVPKEILELQETAEEEIESLFPGTSDSQKRFLSYPVDGEYGKSQDSILIEMFTYRPPQESLLVNNKQVATGATAIGRVIQSGLTRNKNLRDFIGAVRLPIPQEISSSNEVDWGPKSANALEAGAFYAALGPASALLSKGPFEAISQASSIGTDLANQIKGGQFGANSPMGLQLSSFLSALALGQMGISVDPNQFITRALGASINPNLELLFNGPKLRQFNFSFEFAPNGQEEARVVRRIIRMFKQGMAAKRNVDNAIFLGSPNVFRLKYMNGARRIKGLNAFKVCALLGCELDYTAGGKYAAYADDLAVSQPARMTMKLAFQELTPIFDTDYLNYDSTDPKAKLYYKKEDISFTELDLGRITEDDILF